MCLRYRVLHIITRLIIGGAQENTLYTVAGLNRHPQFAADLLTGPGLGPEGELGSLLKELDIQPLYLNLSRRNINPLYDFYVLLKYYRVIKQGNYDIVHTHSSKAGILGRLAARLAGVKVIVHTIHGLPFHPYQNRLYNQFYVNLEKLVAPITDRIISVADAMTEKAVAAGVAGPDKFLTIRSGMKLKRFTNPDGDRTKDRCSLGIKPDEVVIGKIARLFHLKGHKYLIEAFARLVPKHPGIRLMFAGDGILLKRLREQAAELGVLDKIIFLGLVKRSAIPGTIAMMDIVAHTSLREGLARVLPQALAAGKPVVSFDVDGAKEVIINKKTGLLIPAKDVTALAEAIDYLLENPQSAATMGQARRELVRGDYEESLMSRRIIDEYLRLLHAKAN